MGKKSRRKNELRAQQLQEQKQSQQEQKPVQSRTMFKMPGKKLTTWKVALLCIFIFAVAFFVYSNTLSSDFIWDDEYLIINNSQIKSFANLKNVFKTYVGYGSENINNFYRPMQEISNMTDYALWGLKPFGFHLTNTILHALVSMMVFLLVLILTRDYVASVVASIFWAVHPVHTEAIAYIAGRADSLYSFFMLLSFIIFIKSAQPESAGKKSLMLYMLSILFFVISLLSKEMVIVLPIVLFLYMYYFLRGTENNNLYRKYRFRWIPYFGIMAFYGYLRATVLSFSDIAPASAFQRIPFLFRLFTFFRTVMVYFKLMIFPTDLHMERTIRITNRIMDMEAFFAVAVMVGIVWLAYYSFKKGQRLISFGIVWFFTILLPVSNIIPINSFLAEHWIYMASIGPCMILGLGVAWLWNHIPDKAKSLKIGLAVVIAVPLWLYADATMKRNMDWKDEISFFNSTLKYHPKNARLYLNLGNTYYERKEVDKAIEQYKKSIEINKNYAVAYGNIGSAYLNKRQPEEAEKYLKIALQLKDNYPIAHYNMGIILFNKGQYKEALKELETAVKQLPQLYQAHNMLARTYLKIGRPMDAKASFERSLQIYADQPPIKRSLDRLNKLLAEKKPITTT